MTIYEWNEDTQSLECRGESLPYRSKWACFACRKSFVRKRSSFDETVSCPDCGADAVDMGYLFEPPPRRDQRSWEVMEVLASYRIGFHRASSKVFIDRFLTDDGALHPKKVRARIEQRIEEARQRKKTRD